MKPKRNKHNPLGMKKIITGGSSLYVPPNQKCSKRRKEYFIRANNILGSFSTIWFYSRVGKDWFQNEIQKGALDSKGLLRFDLGNQVIQTSVRRLENAYATGIPQLSNYVFLMVYGNFESLVADLIIDSFDFLNDPNPYESTLNLLMATKWEGKLNKINQAFGVKIGKRRREQKFQNMEMSFLGNKTLDPLELLESMAEIRHRLVHSSGRVDQKFLRDYPSIELTASDQILLPIDSPLMVNNFFILFTELIDDAFSKKFGWSQDNYQIEMLSDMDGVQS